MSGWHEQTMYGWHEQTMYGFDVESTGTNVFLDRIVQATLVKCPVEEVAEYELRSWAINPGVEVPATATAVHGITTEQAQQGRPAPEAVAELGTMVVQLLKAAVPVAAFNAAFDLSMLDSELARYALPTLTDRLAPEEWRSVVDPYVLARWIDQRDRNFKKGRKYRLPDLCERYGVAFEESHQATADAVGAVHLARRLASQEEHIAAMGPKELHTLQRTGHRADMRRLREWKESQGLEHDVDTGWPLHSALATEPEGGQP